MRWKRPLIRPSQITYNETTTAIFRKVSSRFTGSGVLITQPDLAVFQTKLHPLPPRPVTAPPYEYSHSRAGH